MKARIRTVTFCAALAAFLSAPAALAQGKTPKWKTDPYTKNEPKALQQAGYVSYGPFAYGGKGAGEASTTDVEKTLPYAQIRWIETAHFRLGVDLPDWTVPMDAATRAKVRGELERLQQRLPTVDPKTRKLDPWLRAHLFAQRCEELYAEFSTMAGVQDADFPQDPKNVIRQEGATYMGFGPYLGMKDKYLVLLVETMPPYQTYLRDYLGRETKFGQRWHFKDIGCLIYAVSTECDGGRLKHDTSLHCSLAFNVSQCLFDGFRYYNYDLPVWIREGLAHWFERRVDEKWNSYDQTEGSALDLKPTWKWKPLVRAMAGNGNKYAPFVTASAWRDFGDLKFEDHMAVWSRVDFLLAQGPEKWKAFLFDIKGRVNADWSPNQNDLVGAVRDSLQERYGLSPLQFDDKWAEWVKANYPSQ